MITIEKLRKEGFFEVISKIKELGFSCGINDIYVIPPIVSRDTLYFMVTNNKGACNFENLFNFSNLISSIFKTKFDTHVYKENALLEAIDEGSAFSKKYQNALESAILLDKLDKQLPLEIQWEQQARSKNEHNTKRSIELSACQPYGEIYLPLLKRQKLNHSNPNISQNSVLVVEKDKTNHSQHHPKRARMTVV